VPPIPDPPHDKFKYLSEIEEGEVLLPAWWDSSEGAQWGTNGIPAAWVVAYPRSIPAFHDEQRRRAPVSFCESGFDDRPLQSQQSLQFPGCATEISTPIGNSCFLTLIDFNCIPLSADSLFGDSQYNRDIKLDSMSFPS
jgi:hypothetical protein